jgi:hypothetical protein
MKNFDPEIGVVAYFPKQNPFLRLKSAKKHSSEEIFG